MEIDDPAGAGVGWEEMDAEDEDGWWRRNRNGCALDIPSDISHRPLLHSYFFFLLSSFRVARSNSSQFPCVGRGGKLVGDGLRKGS